MPNRCRANALFAISFLVAALAAQSAAAQQVVPGLEVLVAEQTSLIKGKRVGLITNHTAVDRQMRHAIDLIAAVPGAKLTALFAPEHGIRGAAQAGGKVEATTDERTGVPVYSIYGKIQRPTPEMLKDVDVLLYDIQDVGVRFYTYISTMGEGMEAAADKGIPYIVLDRPDPIGANMIEGDMIDLSRFKSFVGAYPVPIRYGLTIGELAQFVKAGMKKEVKLTVVKMKNYNRNLWYDETGLPWIAPSPNIPTVATAIVYPGMCLIEGTNLSEGRGTTQPFEMIGAPYIDALKLADALTALKLPGVLFRPASFVPTISKHQGVECHGIQVHVSDRRTYQPVRVALYILTVLKKTYPTQFEWRQNSIDRLSGSDALRLAIDAGKPVDDILAAWQENRKAFESERRRHLLY